MQQSSPDWLGTIQDWRTHPPEVLKLSEGELIRWLSAIQERTDLEK